MTEPFPQQIPDESLSTPEAVDGRAQAMARRIADLRTQLSTPGIDAETIQRNNNEIIQLVADIQALYDPKHPDDSRPAPEFYNNENEELTLEDGKTKVLVSPKVLDINQNGKPIKIYPKNTFTLDGTKVRFRGLVDPTDPKIETTKHNQPVIETDIDSGGGLHRIITVEEIIENGDNFWSFEELKQEKIERQYNEEISALKDAGVTETLPSGVEGFTDINGNECPVPPLETILSMMQEQQERLNRKIDQGFGDLLPVPFGLSIDKLVACAKQTILDLYVEDPDNPGRADPSSKLRGSDGQLLDLDISSPFYVWEKYNNADRNNEIVYFPKEYTANHQGQTKTEILSQSSVTPGWQVQLTETNFDIPRAGQGTTIGDRPQLEAGQKASDYLSKQQEGESPYQDEIFYTPEAYLTKLIISLKTTGRVIDDYQVAGSVRYLGAAYFPVTGFVANGYWNRVYRRAHLGRVDPDDPFSHYGGGSAVRIS
jgi:hypothetical protein